MTYRHVLRDAIAKASSSEKPLMVLDEAAAANSRAGGVDGIGPSEIGYWKSARTGAARHPLGTFSGQRALTPSPRMSATQSFGHISPRLVERHGLWTPAQERARAASKPRSRSTSSSWSASGSQDQHGVLRGSEAGELLASV